MAHHGEGGSTPFRRPKERRNSARLGHSVRVQEDQEIPPGLTEDLVEGRRLPASLGLDDHMKFWMLDAKSPGDLHRTVRAAARDHPDRAPPGTRRQLLGEERLDCRGNPALFVKGHEPADKVDGGRRRIRDHQECTFLETRNGRGFLLVFGAESKSIGASPHAEERG
jgi:hypothetical protein